MKIIVTGAESQIAQSLKKKIEGTNIKFFFYNKKSLNILNYNEIFNVFSKIKPNILINCAAYTNVVDAEKNITLSNNINNYCLKNLSKITNEFKATLIHFSTDYVFDGKNNKKYNEDDVTNPLSVYGKSKLGGEKQIVEISNNFIILRVSWLFSEYKNNFYKFVIAKLQKNENLYAVNDLFSIPTSSEEIANFLFLLIEKKLRIQNINNQKKIYNFVNSGPIVSWFDFSNFIKKSYIRQFKSNTKIIPISSYNFFKNDIRPSFSALNNKQIINDFGYEIENWHNSINSLINNYIKI